MPKKKEPALVVQPAYEAVLTDIVGVVEAGHRAVARSVNAVMTASYWLVGLRIVEEEQGGKARAAYGEEHIGRLSADLTRRFGRGFSGRCLREMRNFYLEWSDAGSPDQAKIWRTLSAKSDCFDLEAIGARFPLPWRHYVRLMSVEGSNARTFYETEALRGGWTYRQLDRQIGTQYWERVSLAKDKAAALRRGTSPRPGDATTPAEEVHDPYVLEFLNLKDEYGESELEEALVHRLEDLLLEMGSEFTFVGRQRRLRIGESWFRIDLLLYHRRLRCLVLVDSKLTPFSAGDVGQMNLYVSYAREHWALPGENPPIGLILCTGGNQALARYALDGLRNPILAGEYRLNLPDERVLAEALQKARREIGAARLRSR